MIVRWSEEALSELTDILDYLGQVAPEVAHNLATRILLAEENIITLPQAAKYDQATNTYDRYVPNTRVILTYTIHDDFIEIIRVWHTSRQDRPEL